MPRATLDLLRSRLPNAVVFLMYGLTEAFRSTFLPPEQVDRTPGFDRQGNSKCRSARGCAKMVHSAPLASRESSCIAVFTYPWGTGMIEKKPRSVLNRFSSRELGLTIPELAVWSGDTVRMDEEGFLYFIGRRDEMIKTSGYRVSPMEVEEVIYATGLVARSCRYWRLPPGAGPGDRRNRHATGGRESGWRCIACGLQAPSSGFHAAQPH